MIDEVGNEEKKEVVHSEISSSSDPGMNNDVLHSPIISGQNGTISGSRKNGKFFFYDAPVSEETGFWIPVSVPPLPESDYEKWARNGSVNGGYLPDEDMDWNHFLGENKELTMWDVVMEIIVVAGGKVKAVASGDFHQRQLSWVSANFLEQAWREMAQTLTEVTVMNVQEIIEAEPPRWLPDSSASSCMLCSVRFHPILCSRHHCRYCGGVFCSECSKGRSLMPAKFRTSDPQRVCDVCCVRLESVQGYLMDQVSRASQLPTHDLTDLSTLRSWLNFPWGQSMEYEIYKATNALKSYNKVRTITFFQYNTSFDSNYLQQYMLHKILGNFCLQLIWKIEVYRFLLIGESNWGPKHVLLLTTTTTAITTTTTSVFTTYPSSVITTVINRGDY